MRPHPIPHNRLELAFEISGRRPPLIIESKNHESPRAKRRRFRWNRPSADALMMRAGYAVTRAAYRPLGLARKNSGRGGARSFAGRPAARGFAVAVVDDDRGHTRGRDAIDQAIDRKSTRLNSSQ